MDPLLIAVILLVAGLVLLAAEAVLPSHGILGVISGILMIGGVYYCFQTDIWVGVGVLAVMVVASPFVFMWMMAVWPRTPVGKRLVLDATVPPAPPPRRLTVGEAGRTVTDLRPIGECDFGETRVEVISEYGMIRAGERVVIVALDSEGRPVVKAAPEGKMAGEEAKAK